MPSQDDLPALKAENARLIALLEAHGIEWRERPRANWTREDAAMWNSRHSSPMPTRIPVTQDAAPPPAAPQRLTTVEKVELFRRLFKGRADTYPLRWESSTSGRAGYAPACANEWLAGVCEKPRIKCGDCGNRLLIPLSTDVIYQHLAGKHTIGVYPLLEDDTCHFVAFDFDEAEWRDDARAFMRTCAELGVHAALEISRSGHGAHAWLFFEQRVPARDARRLATALISHTCASTRQLELASYDRLFPNQDTMPKGGFGNLIALPLQRGPPGARVQCVRGCRPAALSRSVGIPHYRASIGHQRHRAHHSACNGQCASARCHLHRR